MVAFNSAQGSVVRAVFAAAAKNSYEVGCLTCHKAHGNERPFGLIFPDHTDAVVDFENGDAAAMADGTYPIRNLCVTCHSMGRSY
jgi:cytochrome c553